MVAVLAAAWAAPAQAQQATTATNVQALPDAPGVDGSLRASASLPENESQAGPAAPATIAGTVLDTNGNPIPDARVVLSDSSGAEPRVAQSGSNGEFTFSGLPAQTFRLTVSGPGMGTVVTPEIVVRAGETRFLPKVVLPVNAGVTEVRVVANTREIEEERAEVQVRVEESQRILGVIPNFYTSFAWDAAPMDTKQKFQLAFRSEIDPMAFFGAAALAGSKQLRDVDPVYGETPGGMAKRFAAAYTDDFDGKMLGGAIFPALFHQDPRYFYKGTGSARSRALYALMQTFICRGDNGRAEPNYSEILGSFAAGGISNLYYPAANRGASLTFVNGLIEIGGHAGTNLVREFLLRGLTTHVPDKATGNP